MNFPCEPVGRAGVTQLRPVQVILKADRHRVTGTERRQQRLAHLGGLGDRRHVVAGVGDRTLAASASVGDFGDAAVAPGLG